MILKTVTEIVSFTKSETFLWIVSFNMQLRSVFKLKDTSFNSRFVPSQDQLVVLLFHLTPVMPPREVVGRLLFVQHV